MLPSLCRYLSDDSTAYRRRRAIAMQWDEHVDFSLARVATACKASVARRFLAGFGGSRTQNLTRTGLPPVRRRNAECPEAECFRVHPVFHRVTACHDPLRHFRKFTPRVRVTGVA